MKLAALLDTAKKLLSERQRRTWVGRTRAHVEFRALGVEEYERFAEHVRREVRSRYPNASLEVNPHTQRVIVSFGDDACPLPELVRIVEEAERRAGCATANYRRDEDEHPADAEPTERLVLELAADLVGLAVGTALRVSPLPASKVAGVAASALGIVRGSQRLRRGLDVRYGAERADIGLGVAGALSLGVAQRPVSALVELVHRGVLLREAVSRQRLWEEREAELCSVPAEYRMHEVVSEPRPCPLPRGPIEEYADRAWVVSLAGFAVNIVATRSLQRAIAALFGALPKPARLGRDVFAAELGRVLAARGVLVLSPSALRRLDRIDCLVLQGDLVPRHRYELGEVIVASGVDREELVARVAELYDPEQPLELRQNEAWSLGPPAVLGIAEHEGLVREAQAIARRGHLVLALSRRGTLAGLVEVCTKPQTGIDELVAAAHEAEMRVVIASNDETILQSIPADDTIPERDGMRAGIRRLQREGRVVCLVATGESPALTMADCSIGLTRNGNRVPWAADFVCRDDLSDVRFLIQACTEARKISKQSVHIALGAATLGALVSAGGHVSLTTRRVIMVVNAASLAAMIGSFRNASHLARRALPAARDRTPWHALDAQGVLAQLASRQHGLTKQEAFDRTKPTGVPRSALSELAEAITDELFSPLAPLLAAGAGLSAAVGSFGDASMVGAVVGLNAVIGGVQRFRTERAIRELERSARRRATVLRGGVLQALDASSLVRGDVIVLGPGDVVPADCRVLESHALEVDASSLTGESLPVAKGTAPSYERHIADRTSMLYEGTAIASGQAKAIVVAVGEETEASRGAAASRKDLVNTGVERRLRSLIDMTGPIALAAGSGLVAAGLLRGRKLEDLVGSGVSLAVASVPEGLPLLATAAQLAAAERLSERGALVRNTRSIEALGRVDVLCVDKTGTLTLGHIELHSVTDGLDERAADDLMGPQLRALAAALRAAPDARAGAGHADPTDAALHRAASRLGVRVDYSRPGFHKLSELPYESGRGYHAVVGDSAEGHVLCVKGAPEAVLPCCTHARYEGTQGELDDEQRARLAAVAAELAARGLRVLAVAERSGDADAELDTACLAGLSLRGFLAFSDPVRPSAKAAIQKLRGAGVRPVMLTGDHPGTARSIADQLELLDGGEIMTGAEIAELSDDELDHRVERISVFARVTPSQKVRLVRALQRAGRIVAMAGDGANDAPAIRLANVGIAIGEQSTAAARGAADIVLTDERIETLVDAIAEGRAMWAAVRDAVSILVGGNLGEIGFTLAAGLVDGKPPLNARQLLLVNLLTDVAPAMAIALRPPSQATLESLASEGPDASLGEPLNREIVERAVITGLGAGAAWITARSMGSKERADTVGLLALVGTQLGQTILSGGMTPPVLATSIGSAAFLAAIVQTPGLSGLFGCTPLGPIGWATALGASAGATALAKAFPDLTGDVLSWLSREAETSLVKAEPRPAVPEAKEHAKLGDER